MSEPTLMNALSIVIFATKPFEGKITCETIDTFIPKRNRSNVKNAAKASVSLEP